MIFLQELGLGFRCEMIFLQVPLRPQDLILDFMERESRAMEDSIVHCVTPSPAPRT